MTISPSEPWESQRPRDRMFEYAIDRINILQDFARRHCQVPNCGGVDEEGEPIACSGDGCGEKRLSSDHRRELLVMRNLKRLIEHLEQQELEAKAAEDKKQRGKGK